MIIFFLLSQVSLQKEKVDHIINPFVPCLVYIFTSKPYCTNHTNEIYTVASLHENI